MYLSFYGLREAPFRPTPDPKFLYQSARHADALAQLVYGVRERIGFILLTGEIGTGKTTLLRALFDQLDQTTEVAYIPNTTAGIDGVLEYAFLDWGLASPKAMSHAERLSALSKFLIERYRAGVTPVLVIDEAQNLSRETLEAVRLLSNFETTQKKLMQIVLVGQPELRAKVLAPDLRQLKQRIALRCHLRPLSPEETRLYIDHRLRVAGARDMPFSEAAIREIARYSGGTPRLINTVCDHALFAAFGDNKRRIEADDIRDAIAYLEEGEPPAWKRARDAFVPRTAVWAGRAGVSVLVVLLIAVLAFAANAMGWLGASGH
jgi:general secretion pathway protein A